MVRLAIEFVGPGMKLGMDVYDLNGRSLLADGIILNEKNIQYLKRIGVSHLFIDDPVLKLPAVEDVVQEKTRIKAIMSAQHIFGDLINKGKFNLAPSDQTLVHGIVKEVMSNRSTILHLAYIDRRHDDLFTHSVNVCILSTMTAVSLGYCSEKELDALALGALLHDVGYALVPQGLLGKANPSSEERETLQAHTTCGFELLRRIREFPLLAAHIALQHHEKFDGSGYPRKLAGEDIHKYSRIVALANEYDNMVTGRLNQKGLAAHIAYEKIVATGSTFFDPEVAEVFLSRIALYPIGTLIRLTTGQIGVVTEITPRMQHRPKIKLIDYDRIASGENLPEMDLSAPDNLTVFIDSVLNDEEASSMLIRND